MPTRTWYDNYERLTRFLSHNGHTNVPSDYTRDPKLAAWVQKQRKKASRLTEVRVLALDAIGFEWDRGGEEGERENKNVK